MNTIFKLTWEDSEGSEHLDYFPTQEECEDHAEYLKEETDLINYKIERVVERI